MTEMKISKANSTILQRQARRQKGKTCAPVFKKLLKFYIELTHHSFTASNNKINVILDSNKKPEKKQAFAKTDRKLPVVIPACTEMTVRTTTTKTKYPLEALVEANPRSLPAGLIISPSFQIIEDGQVCVQVSNYTEEDIYIPSITLLN